MRMRRLANIIGVAGLALAAQACLVRETRPVGPGYYNPGYQQQGYDRWHDRQ